MTQCTHVQPPTKPSHALLCSSASAYTPTLSAVPAPPAIDVAGDGYDFMDNGWKDLEDTISPELCMRNARANVECVDTAAISWGKTDAYISTWGGYLANKASSIKCDGDGCKPVIGTNFDKTHEIHAGTSKNFGDGHLDAETGWSPKHGKGVGEWWQTDVGSEKQIVGVVTQCAIWGSMCVTSLKVKTSLDGTTWEDVEEGKTYKANTVGHDINEKVEIRFESPVRGRYVRIYPQACDSPGNHPRVAMRSGVLVSDAEAVALHGEGQYANKHSCRCDLKRSCDTIIRGADAAEDSTAGWMRYSEVPPPEISPGNPSDIRAAEVGGVYVDRLIQLLEVNVRLYWAYHQILVQWSHVCMLCRYL